MQNFEEIKGKLDAAKNFCQGEGKDYIQVANKYLFLHQIFDRYKSSFNEIEREQILGLARELLDEGADPNIWNKNGSPLLHRTIKSQFQPFVDLLKNNKLIDYSQTQKTEYKTALGVCLSHWKENIELIKFLSAKNNDELQDELLKAIDENNTEAFEFLLKEYLVSFSVPNQQGQLPLHLLIIKGNKEEIIRAIEYVKEHDANFNLNQPDLIGNTLLHWACCSINSIDINIIEILLNEGGDPNIKNHAGETVLHLAIENNHPEIISLLLEKGANPNLKDGLGRTPLMKLMTKPELIYNSSILSLFFEKTGGFTFEVDEVSPIKLAYERGFWIRQVGAYGREPFEAIEREVSILKERSKMSNELLVSHEPEIDIEKFPEYCFSPATFVKAGIPVSLFNQKGFGVIIQTQNPIPTWCSGLKGQIMTDRGNDINFKNKNLLFKYDPKHQCQNKSSNEIALQLQALFKEKIDKYSALEKYEVLTGISISKVPYNEGLFRYLKSEIIGFHISLDEESIFFGLFLRQVLNLTDLPFYTYHSEGLSELDVEKVKKVAANYQKKKHFPQQNNPELPVKLSDNRNRLYKKNKENEDENENISNFSIQNI